MMQIFARELAIFRSHASFILLHAILVTTKISFRVHFFSKFSSNIMTLCNNSDQTCFSNTLNKGSYMSAHVLLNLLNKLGKSDKNVRFFKHFITFSQQV